MRFTYSLAAAALVSVAQAHFTLEYPAPRGEFDEDVENKFCGGIDKPADQRVEFPLSGGTIAIDSHHANWKVSVLISTEDSATSFNNFKNSTGKEQFAVAASIQSGEGVYCFPIDVSQLGLGDEVKEGSKATLQIAFDGGDGNLYQCADVVFSSSVKSPSNDELKCKSTLTVPSPSPIGTATATSAGAGSTAGGSSTAAGGSGGSSSTSPASKSSPAPSSSSSAPAPSGGAAGVQIPALTGLLGLFGLAFAAL